MNVSPRNANDIRGRRLLYTVAVRLSPDSGVAPSAVQSSAMEGEEEPRSAGVPVTPGVRFHVLVELTPMGFETKMGSRLVGSYKHRFRLRGIEKMWGRCRWAQRTRTWRRCQC
jgi:hypothetical protein